MTEPSHSPSTPSTPFDPSDYWQRRLEEHTGLDGVGYLGLGRPYNEALYQLRREVFDAVVGPLVSGGPFTAADVGSGTGFYIERWLANGATAVSGCDLTPVAVSRLSSAFPGCRFEQADIGVKPAPFGGDTFDMVSAMDMLFHIVDDEQWRCALDTLSALVAPGGHLLIADNFPSGAEPLDVGQHQRIRPYAMYLDELRSVGFDLVAIRPMFVLMNGPVGAGRLRTTSWRVVAKLLSLNATVAGWAGRAMLPLERRLVTHRARSASTELMVLRRR